MGIVKIEAIPNYYYGLFNKSYENYVYKSISEIIGNVNKLKDSYEIDEIFELLKNDLFKLRIDIINDLIKNRTDYKFPLKDILEEIYKTEPGFIQLEQTLSNCLLVISEMSNSQEKSEYFSVQSILDKNEILPPINYDDYLKIMKLAPNIKSRELIIENSFLSLKVDFLAMFAFFVISGKINLKSEKINNLMNLLKNTTEKYGVSCYNLGIWSPDEQDYRPWINNIKILISAYSFDDESKKRKTYSLSEMKELILH